MLKDFTLTRSLLCGLRFTLSVLLSYSCFSQSTLQGKVVDAGTGEALPMVNVYLPISNGVPSANRKPQSIHKKLQGTAIGTDRSSHG